MHASKETSSLIAYADGAFTVANVLVNCQAIAYTRS